MLALILALCTVLAPTATVTEDSPGWDCRTMGNATCGADHPLTARYTGTGRTVA